MKARNSLCVIIVLILTHFPCIGQFTKAKETYYQRLYFLGKIWGYTKYFHPEVAKCGVDWDKELLQTFPLIKNIEQDEVFNQLLVKMMKNAGNVAEQDSPLSEVPFALSYNLNLDWFNDPLLSTSVKNHLEFIRDNFRPSDHCLLNTAFSNGNPTFEKDAGLYAENGFFPIESQRALAIFRYWNIINYFFPYKYQLDQDWDTTLKQFIPSIIDAPNELAYNLAFKEMTTYINDAHGFFNSRIYSEWIGYYRAPFLAKFIEDQTVITKVHPSVAAQIKVGDIITEIDGASINIIREKIRKYTEGSNEASLERNICNTLVRGKAGKFSIKVKNDKGEESYELERKSFNAYQSLFENLGKKYELLTTNNGCQVGYVDMDLLTIADVPNMFSAFKDLPAIIVDIRNYPQGTLWEMVNYLYPTAVNFSSFTNPDIRYPGTLTFRQHSIGQGGIPYKGKLLLLFNEDTQSQAEFTIMGLEKHPNAIKIGSQTAGADGNVSSIDLPGGIRTYFSGLGVFYPDGRETQRIGIIPDIQFVPTIEGIRAGKDEMLNFALDCTLIGTEIPLITNDDGIDIFPNPLSNRLNIRSDFSIQYTIQVTNMIGQFIEGFQIGANTFNYDLDFSDYPSGIYLLAFREGKEVFATKKIVKF